MMKYIASYTLLYSEGVLLEIWVFHALLLDSIM